MANVPELAELWHQVDAALVTPPAWQNSKTDREFRSYSSNSDAKIQIEGDVLTLAIRSQKTLIVVFSVLFVPAFTAIAWFAIHEWYSRLFATVCGPVVGTLTFALIYRLRSFHEGLGDYLVVDRAKEIVWLPRIQLQFPRSQIICLQWMRGRSRRGDDDVQTDLNLLVSEPPGIVRYHVMGAPPRRLIEQVVLFSTIPVDEIDLGRRGYRDADCKSD